MLNHYFKPWIAALAALLLAISFGSQASDRPTEDPSPSADDLRKLVEAALPQELITEDNTKLVAQLLNPKLGIPLSRSFNPYRAIRTLFGRGGASLSPECRKLTTPTGDMATDECIASKGLESGKGAYKVLRYSKHLALGNVAFLNREADRVIDPAALPPVKMTDREAYEKAVDFLKGTFRVPGEEIFPIPAEAKMLPVRTIALGWASAGGPLKAAAPSSVPVEKMVLIPRGLFVQAHERLQWVPGPGKAMVVMDDRGVKEAIVQGWQEVRPHPKAHAENAKTRSELVSEIAEDIASDLQGPVQAMNMRLMLTVVASENGVGLLLPAVQMAVLPVPRDLTEDEQVELSQMQTTTAGMVREYPLVRMFEEFDQNDDEPLK
ncbi:MAG TPA: hypothetical protein ENI99_02350 [Sedimenticola sp.]|nr:hypothetical protein [Sedimenticola sp.]